MRTYPNRALAEGLLTTVLMIVLATLGLILPWLFFLSGLLFPIPLIIMVFRHGLKKALLAVVVAYTVLVLALADYFTVTLFFAQFCSVAIFFGLLFRNKIPAGKSLFAGVVLAALITIAALALISSATDLTLNTIENQFNMQMEKNLELYQKSYEISQQQQDEMRQSMHTFVKYMVMLLPGSLIIGAMLSTLFTFLITRVILIRLKHNILPLPPFSHWTFPWHTVWGVIIGLALMIVGDRYGLGIMAIIGKNILYVFGFSFFLLGVAVAVYYYKKLSIPKIIKWLIIVLALLFPATPYLLAAVGVLDPLVDIRKLNKKTEKK